MFLYRSSFSAFILHFSFETSDEFTVYIESWMIFEFVRCLILSDCTNEDSNSPLLGMLWMKYVSLLLKPLTNAAYADYGWVSAFFDKSCSWSFKLVTSSLTYFSL